MTNLTFTISDDGELTWDSEGPARTITEEQARIIATLKLAGAIEQMAEAVLDHANVLFGILDHKLNFADEPDAAMPFLDYVKQRKPSDDPKGDMANDLLVQSGLPAGLADAFFPFPKDQSFDAIRNYLVTKGAIPDALQAFEELWEEYQKNWMSR